MATKAAISNATQRYSPGCIPFNDKIAPDLSGMVLSSSLGADRRSLETAKHLVANLDPKHEVALLLRRVEHDPEMRRAKIRQAVVHRHIALRLVVVVDHDEIGGRPARRVAVEAWATNGSSAVEICTARHRCVDDVGLSAHEAEAIFELSPAASSTVVVATLA